MTRTRKTNASRSEFGLGDAEPGEEQLGPDGLEETQDEAPDGRTADAPDAAQHRRGERERSQDGTPS